MDRCFGRVPADETPIGYIPRSQDIHIEGLKVDDGTMQKLCNVDRDEWMQELDGHQKFLGQFGERLPGEIWDEYNSLEKRFKSW
jgi:phosphoenolpyruvate carboxykinase (GTP)